MLRVYAIPIYHGRLKVSVADMLEDAGAAIGVSSGQTAGRQAFSGHRMKSGLYEYCIAICRRTSPGAIAHEAKHTLNAIFSNIGQALDLNNDEAECRLLEWIVNRVEQTRTAYLKAIEHERTIPAPPLVHPFPANRRAGLDRRRVAHATKNGAVVVGVAD